MCRARHLLARPEAPQLIFAMFTRTRLLHSLLNRHSESVAMLHLVNSSGASWQPARAACKPGREICAAQLINLRDFTGQSSLPSGEARQTRCWTASRSMPPIAAESAIPERHQHSRSAKESPTAEDKLAALDAAFMSEALLEAGQAAAAGEVPVGAVLVLNDEIVARAHNSTAATGDPVAHAEILCIQRAAAHLGSWRLLESTLYVTLEPCAMCAGAMLQSRIGTVVYGARNPLSGADGSWVNLLPRSKSEQQGMQPGRPHPFHPNMQVRRGVRSGECAAVLREFFRWRRTQPDFSEVDVPFGPKDLTLTGS